MVNILESGAVPITATVAATYPVVEVQMVEAPPIAAVNPMQASSTQRVSLVQGKQNNSHVFFHHLRCLHRRRSISGLHRQGLYDLVCHPPLPDKPPMELHA